MVRYHLHIYSSVLRAVCPGILHKKRYVPYGMVLTLSGRAEYRDSAYPADILQRPCESLGLVIVLLLVNSDNQVSVFCLHCRRQGVHVADYLVRQTLITENGLAVPEEFAQGTVAAYYEVGSAYKISRVFGLWELSRFPCP